MQCMNDGAQEVTLRVAEAYHRDVGKDIARIDRDFMDRLGISAGDVIEIAGSEKAYATVLPGYPGDAEADIVRVDGGTRGNAHVGIDDRVRLRKVVAKDATSVVIAPTQAIKLVGGTRYLLRYLEGRPIKKGQHLRVETVDQPITFVVTSTHPSGVVLVTRSTRIKLKERPVHDEAHTTQITYEDIGGLRREISLIREMIELPLRHPELFQKLGIAPPRGVLLYGPPGTGKTMIAKAVASETSSNFISISGPEIVSKYYGESERHLREIFEDAEKEAPSIIFIDEIDSIAPKRGEVAGETERRIVAQLLSLMDGLQSRGEVVVIAATNRPNDIDLALRRGGRFDREIDIGVPDRNGRFEILQVHTRGMPLDDEMQEKGLEELAELTHGFVGADTASLCKEAAMHALRRTMKELDLEEDIPSESLDQLIVTKTDFYEAMRTIEPSAMREVFVEVPKVRWSDIGGLEAQKQELIEIVEWPLRYPGIFEDIGTTPPTGVLLYGPTGTGKTMIAKAVATESSANFISIKGPELLSKYVGESEKAVREIFRKARQASPAIIFFDEVDSIVPARGSSADSFVTERVVSQILTELDGLEELRDVVVIAATNRIDLIDPALLRAGRIDRLVHIPMPDKGARLKIFEIQLDGKPLSDDVSASWLTDATDGYSGADIHTVCREAAILALREVMSGASRDAADVDVKALASSVRITREHFERAIEYVRSAQSRTMPESRA